MKIETKLTKDYGKGSVTIEATTGWKKEKRKLKFVTTKGSKKITQEVDVHWGTFLKFCELVWRMTENVEIS